ncbi:hypothetical protein MKX08_005954 [Trichoderma sp. CBMAI-0020]|nr:hypothetical protein MKX08_005954 [Trichoderma sp. CBMAI-0020]
MLIVVGLPKTLNALYSMMPLVEKSNLIHLKKSDWEADTAARGWQYATLTHHDWVNRYKEIALYAPDVDGYSRHGGEKETLRDIVEFAKKIAHDTGNELPADFPCVQEMLGETTP